MRKITITEEELEEAAVRAATKYNIPLPYLGDLKEELFPPAPQWITDEDPRTAKNEYHGEVAIPAKNMSGWTNSQWDEVDGWPWMRITDAQQYGKDNPAPNPFERDLKTQKQ